MNTLKLQEFQENAARSGLLNIVLKAAFIALVSFGGPAGALAAIFPNAFFGLSANIACPRGSEMTYEEWYDGESNQVRMYCVDPAGGEVQERTFLALLVWLGVFFLAAFYIAFTVLLIRRAVLKKKYRVDT